MLFELAYMSNHRAWIHHVILSETTALSPSCKCYMNVGIDLEVDAVLC